MVRGSWTRDESYPTDDTGHVAGVDDGAVARWLYDGERLACTLSLSPGWVAVTSHRVLAYDPERDGSRFESFHRLNVRGVEETTGGDAATLARVPYLAVYALFSLGGWAVLRGLSLGSLAGVNGEGESVAAMVGPVFSVVDALLSLVTTGLFLVGVVLTLSVVGLGWRYVSSRSRRLVVHAGVDDAVRFRLPPGRSVEVAKLQQALEAGDDAEEREREDDWMSDAVTDRAGDR